MKASLVVLAAGMGSRYGGLKQIDAFGPNGETILDYSVYDAVLAGFSKVVFVIRKSFYKDFKEFFSGKFDDKVEIDFVFQEVDMLPEGIDKSFERQKPWGTAHAVYVTKDVVKEPFAVINADDYYGRTAFSTLASYYSKDENLGKYALVGYELRKTMSEHGTVNRGVCKSQDLQTLEGIKECLKIGFDDQGRICYPAEDGSMVYLADTTPVSMNCWGFTPDYFDYCDRSFRSFLLEQGNTPTAEFFIPILIEELISKGEKTVEILPCKEEWFGVTYKEDKPFVQQRIGQLIKSGIYPEKLW